MTLLSLWSSRPQLVGRTLAILFAGDAVIAILRTTSDAERCDTHEPRRTPSAVKYTPVPPRSRTLPVETRRRDARASGHSEPAARPSGIILHRRIQPRADTVSPIDAISCAMRLAPVSASESESTSAHDHCNYLLCTNVVDIVSSWCRQFSARILLTRSTRVGRSRLDRSLARSTSALSDSSQPIDVGRNASSRRAVVVVHEQSGRRGPQTPRASGLADW